MGSIFALKCAVVILVLVLVCIELKPLQEPQAPPHCCGDTQPETNSIWVAARDNSACNDWCIYTCHSKDEKLSGNQTVWKKEYPKRFKFFIAGIPVISSAEGLEPEGRDLLRHFYMIGLSLAVICSYVAVSLFYLHSKKKFWVNLKQFDQENRDVVTENQDERDSENWPLSATNAIEVNMKNLQKQRKLGEKWEKDSSFLYAFGRRTFDHFFNFRRDQSFTQKCTVCPASVSLASHFASGTYGQPGSSQQLQKEGVRLASFKDFPTSVHVSAIRLAQAGFFYTGERDMVRCFSCGVTHDGWQMGDRPTLVHARISPNCPLVRGSDTANLPLPLPVTNRPNFPEPGSIDSGYSSHSYGSSGVPSVSVSSGSASYRGEEMQSDEAPDAVTDSLSGPPGLDAASSSSSSTTSSMVSAAAANGPIASSLATPENSMFSGAPLFGIATPMDGGAPRNLPMPTKRLDLGGAVYPLYSQMDARKRSFSNWVEDQGLPSVDELITLGFFYAGYADCVRCFFCGIGLKSWEPGDIPAEVHARWRPTCEYLRLVKGDEFVDQVANGGRNVQGRSGAGSGQDGQQPALIQVPSRDAAQAQQGNSNSSAPSNSSNQQGSAPPAVEVPDIPVVRRARETGYTDQQIAEGIQKLRLIGMERAIEVMLVEVLINLFRDNPPQPQRQQQQDNVGNNDGNNAGDGNVARPDAAEPGNNADLQRDGAEHDDAVPDNAAHNGADDPLRERQNVLQQENARLRNMRTCQRCHEQPVGVIFLPCGHIIACTTCAPNIRRCLRCDTVIRATANVYFS